MHPETHQYYIHNFIKDYDVNTEELLKPVKEFETIGEFFARGIKPRNIELDENAILSPADCEVLSVRKVQKDQVTVVKNRSYNLGEFLNGNTKLMTNDEINDIKLDSSNDLYSATFHLKMGSYHHVHAPTKFHINRYKYIKGDRRDYQTLWTQGNIVC